MSRTDRVLLLCLGREVLPAAPLSLLLATSADYAAFESLSSYSCSSRLHSYLFGLYPKSHGTSLLTSSRFFHPDSPAATPPPPPPPPTTTTPTLTRTRTLTLTRTRTPARTPIPSSVPRARRRSISQQRTDIRMLCSCCYCMERGRIGRISMGLRRRWWRGRGGGSGGECFPLAVF